MLRSPDKPPALRFKRGVTWLLAAVTLHLLIQAPYHALWAFFPDFAMDLLQRRPLLSLGLSLTGSAVSLFESLAILVALQHLIAIDILGTTRQRRAGRIVQAIAAIDLAIGIPFFFANILGRFGTGNTSSFTLPSWLADALYSQVAAHAFSVMSVIHAAAWICILIPPFPCRARCPEPALHAIRFAAIALFLISPISYINYMLGQIPRAEIIRVLESFITLDFERSVTDVFNDLLPWFFPWGPTALYATLFFPLLHLRKHARKLLPRPNHCTACDYALDPAMTTCPECGANRQKPST